MLFTKGASSGGSANKVVAASGSGNEENKDGGKDSNGIVIYNGDDDGGVGECDDEDLRLLESMGGAKNKASESEQKLAVVALETKGRIQTHIKC